MEDISNKSPDCTAPTSYTTKGSTLRPITPPPRYTWTRARGGPMRFYASYEGESVVDSAFAK